MSKLKLGVIYIKLPYMLLHIHTLDISNRPLEFQQAEALNRMCGRNHRNRHTKAFALPRRLFRKFGTCILPAENKRIR